MYGDYGSSLRDLPRLRNSKRRRASSWDRSGGNDDRLTIRPGESAVLADLDGPGSINHIWCTVARDSPWGPDEADGDYLRKLISELTAAPVFFYYYIDYELFDGVQDGLGYFHASYNRQNPTDGIEQGDETLRQYQVDGTNLDGAPRSFVPFSPSPANDHPCAAFPRVKRGRMIGWVRHRHRHRHRGLLQHRLVPGRGVLGAVPRHHPARWAELERRDLAVPLSTSRTRSPSSPPSA